ncbi:MoeA protein [Acinetobacter sp. 194]|uniref:MoeA protein n=1 Tax=Acinetobacter shaoyimingii TaxID=2715164 RepID=UPI0014082954|nr:MoeA protein [Acinetobacter shaoyimingii]NHB59506.1 MoeA protein [Acinetobacter shaoyimingii]
MNIKNEKFMAEIYLQCRSFVKNMPNPRHTEVIPLEQALGRRLAEDVFAQTEYPNIALSAVAGSMLMLKENITNVEHYQTLLHSRPSVDWNVLNWGGNPYKIEAEGEYKLPTDIYMPIGRIANTVISKQQESPWLDASLGTNENLDPLEEIRIGSGLIEVGSDYKANDLILKREEMITASKKALLRQADVKEVTVFKKVRVAIALVDYDLEETNKDIELEYVQDCLSTWGFDYDVFKIKPFKRQIPQGKIVEDAGIATDYPEFKEKIEQLTHDYDYVIACGLEDKQIYGNLGLLASFRTLADHGYPTKNRLVGNRFKMIIGEARSPAIKEDIRLYNEKGIPQVTIGKLYQDFGLIGYIPGRTLDIIVNMHLYIKPTLLSLISVKVKEPEWKVGRLVHDYTLKKNDKFTETIIWAHVMHEDTYELSGPRYAGIYPELTIVDIEEERPDFLKLLNQCNCFIPVRNNETEFKNGDFFFYLEI